MKKMLMIGIALTLTSCACIDYRGPEIDIVRYEDKYLNCYGLLHAINEAETMLDHAYSRCHNPYVFAPTPSCLPTVKSDALQLQYNLLERLNYLNKLSETKGCTKITDKTKQKTQYTPHYPAFRSYSKEYFIPSTR